MTANSPFGEGQPKADRFQRFHRMQLRGETYHAPHRRRH